MGSYVSNLVHGVLNGVGLELAYNVFDLALLLRYNELKSSLSMLDFNIPPLTYFIDR